MHAKGRGRCKKGDFSAPVVELIATAAAGADARLRRALDMVLQAAARQSPEMGTSVDRDDTVEHDAPRPPQHPEGQS